MTGRSGTLETCGRTSTPVLVIQRCSHLAVLGAGGYQRLACPSTAGKDLRRREDKRPEAASFQFKEHGSFSAWAMRTVRNRAIDSSRRDTATKRPRTGNAELIAIPELMAIPDPSSRTPLEGVIFRSDAASLHAALRRIPDAQAVVISLAFFGDLTHAEIAAHLNLPEGTVKGRMRLGLEKLRGRMGEGG